MTKDGGTFENEYYELLQIAEENQYRKIRFQENKSPALPAGIHKNKSLLSNPVLRTLISSFS
ncbi:MAG: hypothetical protein WC082_05665 [Victivallales bacterium]